MIKTDTTTNLIQRMDFSQNLALVTQDEWGCYLKMSFKEGDKWNNMCLPHWGWKKLETLLDDIDKYLCYGPTTPEPVDISKRFKVSNNFCPHVNVHKIRNVTT